MKILVCFPFSAAEQLERHLTGQPLANVTDMKAGF